MSLPNNETRRPVDAGERNMTLLDFARKHGKTFGWPIMGAFTAKLDKAGRLTGTETSLLAEIKRFAQASL